MSGIPPNFKALYDEAFVKARGLVEGVKNTGYNSGGVSIRDYSRFFPLNIHSYEIHKKALRLISITSPENLEAKNLQEGLEDTLVDLINYSAFAYAEATLRRQEALARQEEYQTVKEAIQHTAEGA